MYLMGEWEGRGKTCYIHHHNLFNPTIGLDQISSFEDKTFKSRSFVLQFVGRLDKETNPHCFKRSRAPSIGHTFWIFWPILGDIYISLLSWEKNKHRTRIYFSQWRKSKKHFFYQQWWNVNLNKFLVSRLKTRWKYIIHQNKITC